MRRAKLEKVNARSERTQSVANGRAEKKQKPTDVPQGGVEAVPSEPEALRQNVCDNEVKQTTLPKWSKIQNKEAAVPTSEAAERQA